MEEARVLMLLQADFPPDMRVEKEALTLLRAGYRVWILADNRRDRAVSENYKGIEIVRLPHRIGGKKALGKLFRIPAYPNPLWLAAAMKIIREHQIDAVHAHDLPMAPFGVHLARYARVPLVVDLHENYPAAMKRWWKPGISGLTVRNPVLAGLLEKLVLRQAEKVLVVGSEHKRLLERRGVDGSRIHIVENTPYRILAERKWSDPAADTGGSYDLLYFGKLNPERGLELAVDSLPLLAQTIPSVRLVIIGDGPWRGAIERTVREKSMANRVLMPGWLSLDEASEYFASAKICIMPHESNEALDIGAPNKLFEYMALGRPVVVPDAGAVGRIVRETGAGATFRPGSVESFVRAVLFLVGRENEVGALGRKAVLEKYNWENTKQELERAYSDLGFSEGREI